MALHTGAAAHGPGTPSPTDPKAPIARVQNGPPLSFDWLANRPGPQPHDTRAPDPRGPVPGQGAYICSAAGFGEMSRCTER